MPFMIVPTCVSEGIFYLNRLSTWCWAVTVKFFLIGTQEHQNHGTPKSGTQCGVFIGPVKCFPLSSGANIHNMTLPQILPFLDPLTTICLIIFRPCILSFIYKLVSSHLEDVKLPTSPRGTRGGTNIIPLQLSLHPFPGSAEGWIPDRSGTSIRQHFRPLRWGRSTPHSRQMKLQNSNTPFNSPNDFWVEDGQKGFGLKLRVENLGWKFSQERSRGERINTYQ